MVEKMTAVAGSMLSGKTLELGQIAERYRIAGRKVRLFKPKISDRGEGPDRIRSRFAGEWEATPITDPLELLGVVNEGLEVVMVDEVQFLSQKDGDGQFTIVKVFEFLRRNDVEVVFAGLPRDFRGEPFGPMAELLARSQEVNVLYAVCDHVIDGEICGLPATETQRFVNEEPASWEDEVVQVGDKKEGYAARCLDHHVVQNKPVVVFDSSGANE
jgi:thymidine kinase